MSSMVTLSIFVNVILPNLFVNVICQDYTLKMRTLSITYPVYSYGGVSAMYNDILYGWNGIKCLNSELTSCGFTTQDEYTLNLSSISISDNNMIILPNNTTFSIKSNIDAPDTSMHLGTGPETFTVYEFWQHYY